MTHTKRNFRLIIHSKSHRIEWVYYEKDCEKFYDVQGYKTLTDRSFESLEELLDYVQKVINTKNINLYLKHKLIKFWEREFNSNSISDKLENYLDTLED